MCCLFRAESRCRAVDDTIAFLGSPVRRRARSPVERHRMGLRSSRNGVDGTVPRVVAIRSKEKMSLLHKG